MEPDRRTPILFLARFVATGLFSGYSPIAPGTAGSMVGFGLALLLPGTDDALMMAAMIVTIFIAGVFVSGCIATKDHPDPPRVVIDEIVGSWIALYLLPRSAPLMIVSFLLFRLLDIVKPFPARQAEKLTGGWGIMVDDVVAGIYANLACRLILLIS